MGPYIFKKQNETSSIRCLAAMRQFYSNAKTLFAFQVVLTTLVVILLTLINMFHNIEGFLATYCVLIAVADSIFFDDFIKKQKEKGAAIQEIFDTNVLKIEWNDLIEEVDHEVIFRYSEEYKKKEPLFDSLINWYSAGIREILDDEAKIICQYSNCRYDLSLRKDFSKYILILLIVSSLSVISFALVNNLTLKKVVINIFLPLLPIIVFSIQRIKENNKSIKTLKKMKELSTKAWSKVVNGNHIDLTKITRQVQDCIYQNRKDSPLIFDWFYKYSRNSLENEMNYSVEQLVAQYQESNKKNPNNRVLKDNPK